MSFQFRIKFLNFKTSFLSFFFFANYLNYLKNFWFLFFRLDIRIKRAEWLDCVSMNDLTGFVPWTVSASVFVCMEIVFGKCFQRFGLSQVHSQLKKRKKKPQKMKTKEIVDFKLFTWWRILKLLFSIRCFIFCLIWFLCHIWIKSI